MTLANDSRPAQKTPSKTKDNLMRKIYLATLLSMLIVGGCGSPDVIKHPTRVDTNGIQTQHECLGEDCGLNLDHEASVKMVDMQLAFMSLAVSNQLTVDILCPNTFGSGNDYAQNGVTIALTSGSGTVSLVSGVACTIKVQHYFDSTPTDWQPASSPLTISVSGSGTVTAVNTAVRYSASTNNLWLTAYPNGSYNAIIYTASDPASTSPISTTPISSHSMTLTVQNVPAPTVSGLALYSSSLNGGSTSYTLSGSASASVSPAGTLGCKYINSSSANAPSSLTSWSAVNTFYASFGTTCPTLNSQGNWTSIYDGSNAIIVVFANTVNNLTSYVAYSVGP